MVDFIVNNYILIMIIAAFLIFALIGFAVDLTKNKKDKEADLLTEPNDEVMSDKISESVNEMNSETEVQDAAEADIPDADSVNMNMDN